MASNIRATLLIETEGAAANEDLTLVRPFRIYDFHGVVSVQGNNGNVSALQRQALGAGGFNAVSSNLDTSQAVSSLLRTTSITIAQDDAVATDVLRVAASGGDGTGRVLGYIACIPRAITHPFYP